MTLLLSDDFDKGQNLAQKGKFKEAYKIFYSLSLQGNKNAQYNLAILYKNGYGVAKDEKKAAKWYKSAARKNDNSIKVSK